MRQATTGAAALADPSQKAKRQGDAAFRGAFSINAAIAVATDGRITATDAIEGVANLAEKSLLTTIFKQDHASPSARHDAGLRARKAHRKWRGRRRRAAERRVLPRYVCA